MGGGGGGGGGEVGKEGRVCMFHCMVRSGASVWCAWGQGEGGGWGAPLAHYGLEGSGSVGLCTVYGPIILYLHYEISHCN